MDASRRDEAKVGTFARSATTRTPHLTQPDTLSSHNEGIGVIWSALRSLEQGPRLRGCDGEGAHKNALNPACCIPLRGRIHRPRPTEPAPPCAGALRGLSPCV